MLSMTSFQLNADELDAAFVERVKAAFEQLKRQHVQPFAPAIGAVLQILEGTADPSVPTFEEMLALIYKAACYDGSERVDWLKQRAPLVASFVEIQRPRDRLFNMQLDDPQWGAQHRRELRESWQRFVDTSERRGVAALASGEGPRRLDPLRVLDLNEGRRALTP